MTRAMLAAVLVSCALSAGLAWHARGVVADLAAARIEATHAAALTTQARLAQAEEATQRAEEARRTHALQEIADAAHLRTQARAVAVRSAAVSGDGLRIDAAAFAASAGASSTDTSIAGVSNPDSRATVLADLLASVELAGREMARVADEARDAGRACERTYDALKVTP